MSYAYAIVGAGRQGVAAAYDLAVFGDASRILFVDRDAAIAVGAADAINRLVGSRVAPRDVFHALLEPRIGGSA